MVVQINGVTVAPWRETLNIIGAVTAVDNSTNDSIDISFGVSRGTGTLTAGSAIITDPALVTGMKLIPVPTQNTNLGSWWVTYNYGAGQATIHSTSGTDASTFEYYVV